MTRRRVGLSALALLVVVLAGLAWWSLRREQSDALPASVPRGADVAPATLPDAGSDPGDASTPRLTAGEQQPLAPAPVQPTAGGELTGSLTVSVRWKADGTPAAGIGLRLLQLDRQDPLYHPIAGVSDERGLWAVMDVQPGRVFVHSDRIEAQAGIVVAGHDTALTIELLPGVLVRGLVVDRDGRPVPGAELWLDGGYTSPGEVSFVGRADNVGRFTLRDIRSAQSVGASAPGHTRSPSARLHERGPDPFDVTLVLGPPGGHVHGLVVDPEGRAVAGATVLVGSESGWPLPDGHEQRDFERAAPLRVVTDERGAFVAEDVPIGTVEIMVRATGWSPWSGSTHVRLGETAEVRAKLHASASVTGIVRDEAGQAVADVHVGTSGDYAVLKLQYAFSSADGRFTLRDLPLGRTALAAFKDGGGHTETVLTLEPGGQYTWDPVLAPGHQISGRILDPRGEGLAGYRVQGVPEGGEGRQRVCVSEADGRFKLTNCDEVLHRVEVRPPERSSYLALATVSGVPAGKTDLDIFVHPDQEQASVVGRVQDPEGVPVGHAHVGLYQSSTNNGPPAASSDPATGAFRVGPVPPGRYFLSAEAEDFPDLRLPEFELAPGEVRDVGAVVFAAPARLLVRVSAPEGTPGDSVGAFVAGLGGVRSARLERQSNAVFVSPPLEAGEYRLEVWGKDAMAPDRTLRVGAGERLELDVALRRCFGHTILLSSPLRGGPIPELEIEIRDRDDAIVIQERVRMHEQEGKLRAGLGPCMPPADYTLKVLRDGQLVLTVPLQMAHAESQPDRSEFELP